MNNEFYNRRYLKSYRKNLRSNATSAEATLWTYLKSKRLKGRKFRRQHSLGNFIVDFYCPEEKLVIELDGAVHFNVGLQVADEARDSELTQMGYKILRFENVEVFEHTENVLQEIVKAFRENN